MLDIYFFERDRSQLIVKKAPYNAGFSSRPILKIDATLISEGHEPDLLVSSVCIVLALGACI